MWKCELFYGRFSVFGIGSCSQVSVFCEALGGLTDSRTGESRARLPGIVLNHSRGQHGVTTLPVSVNAVNGSTKCSTDFNQFNSKVDAICFQ